MEPPDTKYTKSGDLHIAYQVFGAGPDLVVIPPLITNIELFWDHELYRRVYEHYARHVRVLQFDKRGIGSSDRFERAPTLEERIGDIVAVMDAEGVEQASLLGVSEGGEMAQLFATRHPERVDRLLLVNSAVGVGALPHIVPFVQPDETPMESYLVDLVERFRGLVETWGQEPEYLVQWMMPSQASNVSLLRWISRLERQTASPADINRQIESVLALETLESLQTIAAPTLVMQVAGDKVIHPAIGRYLADQIPDSTYVEVPGEDHFLWFMPHWRDISDTILEFVLGRPIARGSTRKFATVLFTDLVGSTAASKAAGDGAWRETLDSHDRICREVIDRNQGRIVKSTGDGVLATFDTPSLAVDAANHLTKQLGAIGLTIRAGVHAGELEFRDDGDISGTAVNLAARVEARAEAGHVYVSSTIRDLLLGSEYRFGDRGECELKGLEGSWHLYCLEA